MSTVYIKKDNIKGTISAPSSKSFVQRCLVMAALVKEGESIIHNVNICDDVIAMINSLSEMGAEIHVTDLKNGSKIVIKKGIDITLENVIVNVSSSATTLRLLMAVATLFHSPVTFVMNNDLYHRTNDFYDDLFKGSIIKLKNKYIVNAHLRAHAYDINGNVSSQFISGLLLVLPLLRNDSIMHITPPIISKSHINMVLYNLKMCGIDIESKNEGDYYIKGNQNYNAFEIDCEGSYSLASNFMVAACLNGNVKIKNLLPDSMQGEKIILDILRKVGAEVKVSNDNVEVKKNILNPLDIEIEDCPCMAPLLIALCSVISDISYIRHIDIKDDKNRNRVANLIQELMKLGCYIEQEQDSLKIYGNISLEGCLNVYTHGDHRICMALAAIAIFYKQGIYIHDVECIDRAYPNFFDDFKKIGVKIKEV